MYETNCFLEIYTPSRIEALSPLDRDVSSRGKWTSFYGRADSMAVPAHRVDRMAHYIN